MLDGDAVWGVRWTDSRATDLTGDVPSRELAAQDPELVTLEAFPGAGHVASWNSDPQRYDALLPSFLRSV